MESISIFAESIDDVSVSGPDALEVTLSNVDIAQLISEVTMEELLDEMDTKEALEYLKNKLVREQQEDADLTNESN